MERQIPVSRYDLSTYFGRVRHCIEISSPFNLLVTAKDVELSKKVIRDYQTGLYLEFNEKCWKAKRVLDSTVHPDTGEPIFLPFRMSCNVLSNLVVTAGMLTPGLGPMGTVFWQWANQSLNVAVNSSNANKSCPITTKQLLINYATAVSASCTVALGLQSLVPRLKVKPHTKLILSRLVPFAAVVSAGIANIFLMRAEELKKGISVNDPVTGESVGISKTAAKYAVSETAASRVINATPIMAVPPLILVKLQSSVLKNKPLSTVTLVNLGLILATSFAILPFGLAVFPQIETIQTSKLEPKFHGLKRSDGSPIDILQFNRGI